LKIRCTHLEINQSDAKTHLFDSSIIVLCNSIIPESAGGAAARRVASCHGSRRAPHRINLLQRLQTFSEKKGENK
jgi:hypothetical protein